MLPVQQQHLNVQELRLCEARTYLHPLRTRTNGSLPEQGTVTTDASNIQPTYACVKRNNSPFPDDLCILRRDFIQLPSFSIVRNHGEGPNLPNYATSITKAAGLAEYSC